MTGKTIALAATALATAALAACASAQDAPPLFAKPQTAADADDVYFLAQLKVDDMEAFQASYVPETTRLLGEAGALVLAVTPAPEVVEGDWDSNWTVLLRFDSQAAFEAFYDDPVYRGTLVPIRRRLASTNNIVLLPAFDPASMAPQ